MDLPTAEEPTKMHCMMSTETELCLSRASLYAAWRMGLTAIRVKMGQEGEQVYGGQRS